MPRKFVFKLQPVLEQRERVEDERTRVVAQRERERLDAEGRLRGLQRQIAQAKLDLRQRLAGDGPQTVNVVDVRLQASASLHMAESARRAALELAGCYQRSDAARRELLAAMTGRKAVATLKERRFDEFRREQAKRELAELDDLVSVRSARSQMEGEAR